jgi:hypothetical protein
MRSPTRVALFAALVGLAAVAIQSAPGAPAQTAVTLAAQSTLVPPTTPVQIAGLVSSRREGETVTIEVRDCGQRSYRALFSVDTHAGGRWSSEFYPGINASVRATWSGASSAPVAFRQQPRVFVRHLTGKRYEISVSAKMPFWRKPANFQLRRQGAWKTVRTVLLTEQQAVGAAGMVWTSARFTASVPRGAQFRAALPSASARPCYVAAASLPVRR